MRLSFMDAVKGSKRQVQLPPLGRGIQVPDVVDVDIPAGINQGETFEIRVPNSKGARGAQVRIHMQVCTVGSGPSFKQIICPASAGSDAVCLTAFQQCSNDVRECHIGDRQDQLPVVDSQICAELLLPAHSMEPHLNTQLGLFRPMSTRQLEHHVCNFPVLCLARRCKWTRTRSSVEKATTFTSCQKCA